ncbi:MAG: hypothetical protein GY809_10125 [Planctomycetes bacterium]|nr:hypothetical protein [Planctomycetota bacterium]
MYRVIPYMLCALAVQNIAYSNDALLHHTTSYDQKQVSVASNASDCVAVWNSYNQDANSGGIFASILDLASPQPAEEFQINQTSAGNQSQPDVAIRPDGQFAVCWRGPWPEIDDENIILRLFDSNGTPITDDILVSTFSHGDQRLPRVTAWASGQYAVAWESHAYPDRSKKAVCCRVFDANGLPESQEMLVTDQTYAARHADIAANGPDRFVVVWLNDRTRDSVWARSFDLQGQALTDSFQVSEAPFKTLTYPRVSANHTGGFAVAWDGDPNAGAEDDIHVRFFDANNAPLCPDTRLNATIAGAQQNPAISVNGELGAIVAWESNHLSADQGMEILTRYIDANGLAFGPEKSITYTHIGDQEKPSLVMSPTGQFMLAWESSGPEISNTDIHYCWGHCPSSSDLNADGFTDFHDFTLLAQGWRQVPPDSAAFVPIDFTDFGSFCSEWLTRSIAPTPAEP